ncbi:MAG: flagellar hook-associated protein 1 FlgK [Alcanivorax sp.]
MADILNIGVSALTSIQKAISTTGNNIANVNTEGYSRQQANFVTLQPQFLGGQYMGTGTTISTIERSFDQYLQTGVNSRTSSFEGAQVSSELANRLDGLLADPAVGLAPALDSFFASLQDVANNPGSIPERQVLLGEAQALVERFNYLDSYVSDTSDEVNKRLELAVSDINSLSQSIADINKEISAAVARAPGQSPNDLLDTRDSLVTQLSAKVSVSTVPQPDGSLNVTIGNGQALVVGFTAQQLQTASDPNDPSQLLVGAASPSGLVTDLSQFLRGGELGALLDFRGDVLDSTRNQLGLLATAIVASFNEQHSLGVDLNGQPGGNFFSPLQAATIAQTGNSGLSSASTVIADVGGLTGDDYSVRYDGAQWTVTNLSTKVSQSGPGPFTVDGLTINVAGAPVAGDVFSIQPTRQAAASITLALSQAEQVAAAGPLRSQENLSNIGSAQLDNLTVTDASGLPLVGPVTLSFNPDALGTGIPGFDVTGIAGGPLAYDPVTEGSGKTFSLGGADFVINGTPEAGDEFVIDNNTGGSGDNRNALALGELQASRILFSGSASFQDSYSRTVADIGVYARQAQSSVATEGVLLEQSVAARNSVSGVNLDEEAANLIRFQQAYQAAAQMIAVADQVFQSLLNATRR